jgi:glutathione S-transferase
MELISATPSPYARKVRIALAEKAIPFEPRTEVPWNDDTSLPQHNPLEKLPVLILDDGTALYESSFILEWIERKHPDPPLLPSDDDGILAHKQFDAQAIRRARDRRVRCAGPGLLRAYASARAPKLPLDGPAAPQGSGRRCRDRPARRRPALRRARPIRPRRHFRRKRSRVSRGAIPRAGLAHRASWPRPLYGRAHAASLLPGHRALPPADRRHGGLISLTPFSVASWRDA